MKGHILGFSSAVHLSFNINQDLSVLVDVEVSLEGVITARMVGGATPFESWSFREEWELHEGTFISGQEVKVEVTGLIGSPEGFLRKVSRAARLEVEENAILDLTDPKRVVMGSSYALIIPWLGDEILFEDLIWVGGSTKPPYDPEGWVSMWQSIPVGRAVTTRDIAASGNVKSQTTFTVPENLTPGVWGVAEENDGNVVFFTTFFYRNGSEVVPAEMKVVRARKGTPSCRPAQKEEERPLASSGSDTDDRWAALRNFKK